MKEKYITAFKSFIKIEKDTERERYRERKIQRERDRGRETERKSVCIDRRPQLDLVDWKENRLFNTLIMQNLYIVN